MSVSQSSLQRWTGSLSAFGSFTVLVSYILFHKSLRNLRYMEFVFYVGLNDFIASIGIGLGKTANGSFACYFQGITTNLNYVGSIFWSTVICYQLYIAACKNKIILDMRPLHIICWGVPLASSLLVFTTNTYGNEKEENSWCFVANRKDSPSWGQMFWALASFYFWVWLCIILNLSMLSYVYYYQFTIDQQNASNVRASVYKLVLYPVILILCWSIDSIVNIIDITRKGGLKNSSNPASKVAVTMSGLQVVLFAIVFFIVNPVVRSYWYGFAIRHLLNYFPQFTIWLLQKLAKNTTQVMLGGPESILERSSSADPSERISSDSFCRDFDARLLRLVEQEVDFVLDPGGQPAGIFGKNGLSSFSETSTEMVRSSIISSSNVTQQSRDSFVDTIDTSDKKGDDYS